MSKLFSLLNVFRFSRSIARVILKDRSIIAWDLLEFGETVNTLRIPMLRSGRRYFSLQNVLALSVTKVLHTGIMEKSLPNCSRIVLTVSSFIGNKIRNDEYKSMIPRIFEYLDLPIIPGHSERATLRVVLIHLRRLTPKVSTCSYDRFLCQ